MVYHYANSEQREKELSAYSEMLSLFPDDPGALNSYAWRMAEIETNLEDALEKIKSGADLIQLYTGFIYNGPALIKQINKLLLK